MEKTKNEFKIVPTGDKGFYVFVDAIEAGLKFDNVGDFSDVAKYVMNEIETKGKFTGYLNSKSVLVADPSGSNHIFPKGRADIFGYVESSKTFLEAVGNCDYQMGNWLTGSEIFDKADKTRMFTYKPELNVNNFHNHTWYNPEKMSDILRNKSRNVSDLELLTKLMNGDEDLAKKFLDVAEPDLLSLHMGGTGHSKYITLLTGVYSDRNTGKIGVSKAFADDDFKFLYKDN